MGSDLDLWVSEGEGRRVWVVEEEKASFLCQAGMYPVWQWNTLGLSRGLNQSWVSAEAQD